MSAYLWPALFAIFAWWFSTGAIIYLDGLPTRTFRWSMAAFTVLAGMSLWGVWASVDDAGIAGAYCAFASALGLWAWHEISFYMGYVTGPRRHACEDGCHGWAHFGHALKVSLWHELAILAVFAVLLAISWGAPNKIGIWTFAILWGMHESARLNVFLGVRNVNAQFLPEHLAYLKSFLTVKPSNPFFPVAVTVSTALFGFVAAAAGFEDDPAEKAGLTFLAAMIAIGIIEHWFLVLPIRAEALWNWGMASRETAAAATPNTHAEERRGAHVHAAHADGRQIHVHGAPLRAELRTVH